MNQPEYADTIYRLADDLKVSERDIMDFSHPFNPLGVSKKVKAEIRRHLKYLHRYPDDDTKRLRKRLGQFHAIDPETILCGNGSSELIYLITKTFSPRRVLIPLPTLPVYERACRICGAEIIAYHLKEENYFDVVPDEFIKKMDEQTVHPSSPHMPRVERKAEYGSYFNADSASPVSTMAFLCNPNYPTGRLLTTQAVQKIADAARDLRCYLVIDEAYIDFSPGESMVRAVAQNPYLFVLRSLSHFYAIAGLRLGYAVLPAYCIERLATNRPPFTVNSLAQQAALASLKDQSYKKESLSVLSREKAYLEKSFRKLGIAFVHSHANFYLVKSASASSICRHLRSKRMLVRDCSGFGGLDHSYMCIAVNSHRENAALVKELAKLSTSGV